MLVAKTVVCVRGRAYDEICRNKPANPPPDGRCGKKLLVRLK